MHFETHTKVNPRSDATRERTERFCFRSSLGSGRLIAIDGRIKAAHNATRRIETRLETPLTNMLQ